MRFVRGAAIGLLAACLPIFGLGCASVSSRTNVLPSLARHRAESQFQAAKTAEQRGQLEKARDLYASLQRHSPNTSEYAHRMGVVCAQLQDYATAGKYFEHARSLDPHNPELLADMGYSAYLQRDYRTAEVLLAESIQIRPGDARAMNNLAMSIGFQGRYDESLALFLQVNSETQALLNLAFVQSQKSENDAAMATYQRVLAHEPGNKVANSALQQLHAANQRTPLASQAARLIAQTAPVVPPPSEAAIDAELSRPRVSNVDEVLVPRDGFEVPVILPHGEHWTASAPKQIEQSQVADSEFELPEKISAPPAELIDEPTEAAVVAVPMSSATDDLANVFSDDDNSPETPMPGTEELAGLDWAQKDLARQQEAIEAGEQTAPLPADRLRGHCPVALRDERRLAPALEEFTAECQGETYRFSSTEARDRFVAHPEWYLPVAGGLDIIQVKRGDAVARGSLEHACWFRHRLHMFSTAENLATFRAAPRDYVSNQ